MLNAFPIESAAGFNELTDGRLAELLNRADAAETFWREIRAEALRRAVAGAEIPGYKLIEGKRGNRKWVDESVAAMLLEGSIDPWIKKLVTPTEAEKRMKNAGKDYGEIAALVEQAPGAPSLARWDESGKPLPRQEFGLEEAT